MRFTLTPTRLEQKQHFFVDIVNLDNSVPIEHNQVPRLSKSGTCSAGISRSKEARERFQSDELSLIEPGTHRVSIERTQILREVVSFPSPVQEHMWYIMGHRSPHHYLFGLALLLHDIILLVFWSTLPLSLQTNNLFRFHYSIRDTNIQVEI
jgi:hypothetical protein